MSDKHSLGRQARTGYSASLLQAAAALYDIEIVELAEAASKAARAGRKYRN